MARARDRRRAAGVALAVDRRPGEGLPVVLLHGLTAARRYVVMGSSGLQRAGHRVVAYDARGHGSSSPPDAVADALRLRRADRRPRARARRAAGSSARCWPACRWARTRACASRSSSPSASPGSSSITPGLRSRRVRRPGAAGALGRAERRAARGRDRGLRRGVRRAADPGAVARRPWRARCASAWRCTSTRTRSPTRCAACRARRRLPTCTRSSRSSARRSSIGSRDEADPGHPLELAALYAELLPAGRLVVEDEGASPLAWQGGRVAKLIAEVAGGRGEARAGALSRWVGVAAGERQVCTWPRRDRRLRVWGRANQS